MTGCGSGGMLVGMLAALLGGVALWAVESSATRPVDSRFDDRFWRELVFNQFDGDVPLYGWGPALYDGAHDPTGRDRHRMPDVVIATANAPAWAVQHVEEHLPGLWLNMTGRPFTGRILRRRSAPIRPHSISVHFEALRSGGEGPCGRAIVGPTADGWSRMTLDVNCISWTRPFDQEGRLIEELFAHELGHVLGFFHVKPARSVMYPRWRAESWPRPKERFHMRLAYEVGSGQQYCGWPFGSRCTGLLHALPAQPVEVLD